MLHCLRHRHRRIGLHAAEHSATSDSAGVAWCRLSAVLSPDQICFFLCCRLSPGLSVLHSGRHARVDEPLGCHGTLHVVVCHKLLHIWHLCSSPANHEAAHHQEHRSSSSSRRSILQQCAVANSAKDKPLPRGVMAHLVPQRFPQSLKLCYELFTQRLIVLCADCITNVCPLQLLRCLYDCIEICPGRCFT